MGGKRGKKVLVLDPARTFIRYVEIIVRKQGYQVTPAVTVAEAASLLEKGGFQMVITTDSLHGDKLEGLHQLISSQAGGTGTPVLVLAADSESETASLCRDFTFVQVRTKPVAMPELLEVLQQNLPVPHTRKKVRVPVQLKALMREAGVLRSYTAFNLSEGGVFLVREDPPPVGAVVEVLLPLPGLENPLKVTGKVVSRVDEPAAGSPPGFGIQFGDMDDTAADRLRDYLSRHMEAMIP